MYRPIDAGSCTLMAERHDEEQAEKLANEAEREARSMEQGTEELGEKVEETRREWERNHRDEADSDLAPD